MSPDEITAWGGVIATVLTVLTGWQMKKVANLQARVDKLEQELEAAEGFGKALIKFVRRILRWRDQCDLVASQAGVVLPPFPDPPDEVVDEL